LIFGAHTDLIATLGHDAAQVAEAGAAARGEASGTLKRSADKASSTFEFDLFVKNDRLEGPSFDEPTLDRAATSP
jgi:hypothetical protein